MIDVRFGMLLMQRTVYRNRINMILQPKIGLDQTVGWYCEATHWYCPNHLIADCS